MSLNLQQEANNHLVPIGIPTICLHKLEPNLIDILSKDNGERHKHYGMTIKYIFLIVHK